MDSELGRLVDALPGFAWTARPDGRVELLNRRWRDYLGLGMKETLGWNGQAAVHPDDLPRILEHWKTLLSSGKAAEIEARIRRHDGTYRWFRIANSPECDETGKILRWYGLNTDIEDYKRLQDATRNREHETRLKVSPGADIADSDLRSMIDTIPMTAWSTNADGYCDFVNQRWLDYAGLTLDQVQGWGWGKAIHPDDLGELVAHWQACLASGEPVKTEARMRRFDGVYRWFMFVGNPLRDGTGSIVKWFGTNIDIEDRKLAEEASRASERNLIQIINTIPTTAWSTRPDGYCDFLSDRWLDYAGFTMEQALGWNWGAVIHPDDAPGLIEYWQAALANGTPVDTEARMRRHDGVYRWFLFRANPLRDEAGNIVKWYGTNVDIEDRKRADEALQASERNLNQIINTLPTTAWSTRPDGYCDFLSDRWLDYAGFTVEEALGWSWGAVIHPDDKPGLIAYWQAALAKGTEVDTEARMRRHDGEYRWFLFRANPLRDAAGNIVKWYGTNVDIEDRKQADQALRASERSLSLIINTIPMLAWSTRPDGFCDFLNQRWLDYAGMTAEQARGWAWGAAIHPDDAKGLVDYWQGCLASGEPVDTEARMRRHDGVYRWFLFRANPLRDEAGNIIRWYGTNTDIEDRKRAVEELRRSEVLLAEGQRVSQTGSFYWRADTDEIRASGELYRVLGFDPGSTVTLRRVAERVHPEDIPLLNEKIAQARASGTNVDHEMRLQMSDGSFKYLRMTAYGTRDGEGALEYAGAIQDVTERRLSEAAMAKVRSELAYMTRVASMGALTASIAHEVNQPLAGIITNANTCLRMLSADPPNITGALETARRSIRDGNRATDVITRLRALFAKKDTANEEVDLNEATREVVALSVNELQRNRVTMHTEFAVDLPSIKGDRIQLQQVILNLLMNASAAMNGVEERPRQLIIRTERDESAVRVSVQDAGVGLGQEDPDRLFEPFYTTKISGLGIGLSVSRSIVESHGGRVWAKPNDGPGATFAFSIPLAPTAANS